MLVRPVLPTERFALQALLLQDPLPNLFLLSLVEHEALAGERSKGIFYGLWEEDRHHPGEPRNDLAATVYVSPTGLVVPFCPWSEHAAVLGRHVDQHHSPQLIIGPRLASDLFWDATDKLATVRTRYDQRLYVAHRASAGPVAEGLRLATLDDAADLSRFSSRMMLEDLGFDPAITNPRAHTASVLRRIHEGRSWVVEQHGRLVFKIDLGSACSEGALVGGTYVVPDRRGEGLCARAMRGVLAALLQTHPCVTLHLNEANAPAVGCYERAGFERDVAMRLMVLEPPRPSGF
jgi:RimJ/RimL family protein N-acetyltransferase